MPPTTRLRKAKPKKDKKPAPIMRLRFVDREPPFNRFKWPTLPGIGRCDESGIFDLTKWRDTFRFYEDGSVDAMGRAGFRVVIATGIKDGDHDAAIRFLVDRSGQVAIEEGS